MQDRQYRNRYLVKYRLSGEPLKTFWVDFLIWDVNKKSVKEILMLAIEEARAGAKSKLKRDIKSDDIEIITFNLIDSE